ncbi:MAG: insulinase family protein [Myxococcota bacterium]|nr:insulinase family protein [Myxococcota bacterium]
MSHPPIYDAVLPNGLGLLLRESHLAAVAEFQIWARVGSADERPGEEGLAHFHEHMLFKGTARRGVGAIAGAVEGVGGRINAYTSYDTTVYHATVPSQGLDVATDVLVDMVRGSLFDPIEIAREIEVVIEEIRRSDDSPHTVCAEALFAAAYQQHPYRAPILGTRESVARFDREQVLAFFRRWYAPDNLLVVACGDFDSQALAARIGELFADATPAGARRARPVEPTQQGLRSLLLRRSFERATLELAWPAVSLAHPDTPYLDLLAFVLGEGESSRLVQRVKEREGCVDGVDASCYTPLDAGLFNVSADLDAERVPDAVEALVAEIEGLRREPVDAAELDKARANFLASEHFERESVAGQARKLGSFQALAGDWRSERGYLEAVRSATAADLLRVARRYLAPEHLTVAAVLPEDAPGEIDDKAIAGAIARGCERGARVAMPPERVVAAAPRAPRAILAAAPASARMPEIFSYQLPNGATLHVEPRREVPVVALRGALLGGLLVEDERDAGLTHFTTSMWMRGTRRRSASELAHAIESIAVEIDPFSGRNSFGLGMEALSERLDPALDLFAEVLLEPAFASDDVERERKDTLAALARREDRLGARVFDLFSETLWRSHPYRLPMLGTTQTVTAFDTEMLHEHHRRWVRGGNLVLGVSGDVDPDAIAASLSRRLADLEGGDFAWREIPDEAAPRERREVELRKDRAQAHLVLGFRGLSLYDPDRFALEVIAQILAGQGGRLFLELRDRRGLAYAVNAMNLEGLAPGLFAVYVATAPEKLDEARTSIVQELERMIESPPPADELDRARRYLAGNFEIDRQRAAARAAHMAADARYGLGPDAQRRYAEQVDAVDAETVLRVARRVIDLGAWTLATIRP